jgi:GNAT superfamily N-acetyltransferase
MPLQVFTLRERPELRAAVFSTDFQPPFWPEYLLHDAAARLYFPSPFLDQHLDFALVGVDGGGKVVARAFSVPFAFAMPDRTELPDGGWDAVILWAHEDAHIGRKPTAVSALEISLLPQARGQGNSRLMIEAMKANARARGFADLFAPVRPSQKHLQPFVSIKAYVDARRQDGLPRDAWLRTHVRVGGRIVKIAPYAMTIVGSIAQWSQWTGMTFEHSGDVAVAGALSPVRICLEQDYGVYVEPGVWVHHAL